MSSQSPQRRPLGKSRGSYEEDRERLYSELFTMASHGVSQDHPEAVRVMAEINAVTGLLLACGEVGESLPLVNHVSG